MLPYREVDIEQADAIYAELEFVSGYLDRYCKVSQMDIVVGKCRGNDYHILWDNLDMEYVMVILYKQRGT